MHVPFIRSGRSLCAGGMLGSKSIMWGPAGPVLFFFWMLVKSTQAFPSGLVGVSALVCLSMVKRQMPYWSLRAGP